MKYLILPITTLFFALYLSAAHAYTPYSHRFMDRVDPARQIQDAVNELEKFNQGHDKVHPAMLKSFLQNKIFPHFDFDAMSRWITGPYARQMTIENKKEFQSALKETFLGALVKHMGGFDPGTTTLRYLRTHYPHRDEAIVTVRVFRTNMPPATLKFDMHATDGAWRIVDVKANGTSAVLYYRQHFIAKLRGYGQ